MNPLAIGIEFENEQEKKQERRKVVPKWARNNMKKKRIVSIFLKLYVACQMW